MNDPWNPSPDEIREWAYDAEALEPCEDFDLALKWSQHEKAMLDLASDTHCPKQEFFLRVLYFVVGDAVRSKYGSTPLPVIEGFIDRGDEYEHPAIRAWQRRSRDLIRNPASFEYELWCSGGLVRRDYS